MTTISSVRYYKETEEKGGGVFGSLLFFYKSNPHFKLNFFYGYFLSLMTLISFSSFAQFKSRGLAFSQFIRILILANAKNSNIMRSV